MAKKGLFFFNLMIIAILLLAGGVAYAGDSSVLDGGILRLSLAPNFGFQVQDWDAGSGAMVFNAAFGMDYGINRYFTVSAYWGLNAWGAVSGGSLGWVRDAYFGAKCLLIGDAGYIHVDRMALSLALGINAVPDYIGSLGNTGDFEEDLHLWGAGFRVWYDYKIHEIFAANFFAEAVYYPDQRSFYPARGTETVAGQTVPLRRMNHPLDLTFEIEGRLRYPVPESGIVVSWGLPFTVKYSPWFNKHLADDFMQLSFIVGTFFEAHFGGYQYPFDIGLKYEAPLLGKKMLPIQRVSLYGRLYLDTNEWRRKIQEKRLAKSALKESAKNKDDGIGAENNQAEEIQK